MQFEEKVWYLASMVEKFDLKKFEKQIIEKIKDRIELRENARVSMNESTILQEAGYFIYNFTESLF